MKRSDFVRFRDIVTDANNQDPIWSAGYLWLNLTERQFSEIYKILEKKGFRKDEDNTIYLPTGLGIKEV